MLVSVSDLNCFKIGFLKLLPIQSSMCNTVMVWFLKRRNNFNVLSELCSFAFLLGYLTHFQSSFISGFISLEVFASYLFFIFLMHYFWNPPAFASWFQIKHFEAFWYLLGRAWIQMFPLKSTFRYKLFTFRHWKISKARNAKKKKKLRKSQVQVHCN